MLATPHNSHFSLQHYLCNSDNVPSYHTRQFSSLSTVPLDGPSTPCYSPGGEQPIHRRTIYGKTACSFPISTNSVYWSIGGQGDAIGVCTDTNSIIPVKSWLASTVPTGQSKHLVLQVLVNNSYIRRLSPHSDRTRHCRNEMARDSLA
jgi:hypothetical protein